jgi:hypothetical protein
MNGLLLAVLMFSQVSVPRETAVRSRGVIVSGRVSTKNGTFQPGFVQTVTLDREPALSTATPAPNSIADGEALEVPVRADGTFEFREIRPGRYTLRTLPLMPGVSPWSIDVGRGNLRDIPLVVPFQIEISGEFVNLARSLPTHPIVQADQGNFTMSTITLDDGTFKLRLSEGENRISVSKLPAGFAVKSIMFGELDITGSSLSVGPSTPARRIVITLQAAPEPLPAITAKASLIP